MQTFDLSMLPAETLNWIQETAAERGYESSSLFVARVMRGLHRACIEERREIEAGLLASLETEASEMTERDWEEIRAEVKAHIEKKPL
jgi:hypothetical protein